MFSVRVGRPRPAAGGAALRTGARYFFSLANAEVNMLSFGSASCEIE